MAISSELTSTDLTIAYALRRYLTNQLRTQSAARSFFRLSGFSNGTYIALLEEFASQNWRLGNTPLEVRSIELIAGYPERVMAPNRSATWYRNHLASGQALVLIQNRLSTDAQSLKDLYPVTELSLSRDGLLQLIEAAFRRYQLNLNDRAKLFGFVRRLADVLFEPQLRDLAEFLTAVDKILHEQPGIPISRAIILALPYLGLFRCLELEEQLNTPRGDKLIRQLRSAARIGGEVLDDRARQDYLRRLETASLNDDESIGGLTVERKRDLLRRFIEGQLRDNRAAMLQVLQIEWREIQLVITAKSRVTRQERLSRAADQLESTLPAGSAPMETLTDLLTELRAGREPDADLVDSVLGEIGDSLPRGVRSEIRRLVKPRTRKHGDFLVGLTALAVELLQPLQADLQPGTKLQVVPNLTELREEKNLSEILTVFQSLFGGIEQIMPDVDWQLAALWQGRVTEEQSVTEPEGEQARERIVRSELPFRVSVHGPNGTEIARAELVWQYRSDSPATATMFTLIAEYDRLRQATGGQQDDELRLRVPVFNSCPPSEEIGDLDIRRPIQSLGTWFEQPDDLRKVLSNALQKRIKLPAEAALDEVLTQLEKAWARFVVVASENGILAADSSALLVAYEGLLSTAITQLRTSQAAAAGFQVLSQAWIIGTQTFDRWAVVPLLHPLKLLWWRERARYFNMVIRQLLDHTVPIKVVDEPRYRRELAATYGSSNFPPILVLPPGEGMPAARFLPVEEADGYELFFREAERGETFGLDTDTLADDEAEIAALRAVEGIIAVVQDYIETYPFVRDGLEIVLFECRNGALPGLLVERLTKAVTLHNWQIRLSIIVHTSDGGAPLFQRVSEWVSAEHTASDRQLNDYFPPVSLKVLQCTYDQLLQTYDDRDIVILADVLAERGQRIDSKLEGAEAGVSLEGYLPTYRAYQEPFQQGELYRRLVLSQLHQPDLVRLFLLTQHAAIERRVVNVNEAAHFFRELTLKAWERDLGRLHDHFNWVICYDPTIDRFLLQSAFPDKVQVIRYSLGLGAKRQHNLTVSSSQKSQTIVERRLASRLAQMLPNAKPDFLAQVAEQLVEQAKQVSGDIVLRAAGPGAFLNELIGLVVAKFETERRYQAQHAGSLTTWILLDDFEHWFGGGKFPDLLFVAINQGTDGELRLHLEILEAKCVGQLSFGVESIDAEEQVRRGVGRLAAAFASGHEHLDALYWYDQLYRAVAGNLTVELEQQLLWDQFREQFHTGSFHLTVEGHAWAFCYDGQVSNTTGINEQAISKPVAALPEIPLWAHHYGRNELCQVLRQLIEASGTQAPEEGMWSPADDSLPMPVAESHSEIYRSNSISPADEGTTDSISSVNTVEAETPFTPKRLADGIPNPSIVEVVPPLLDEEQQWINEKARDLERALRRRGVQLMRIDPSDADIGPSIVRFKLRLSGNETIKKIQAAAEDLARDLALPSTPIIDNVMRSNFVGVDIPRERPQLIELRPLLEGLGIPGIAELPIIIGITPDGNLVTEDLSAFPHLLVAGSTGSGKSVFLRSLLLSLITQYRPGALELLIIDPKQTDFSFFDGLPYLRGSSVFTQSKEACDALLDLVRGEMPRRQQLMKGRSMKIKDFNKRFPEEALPPILALIDEYTLLTGMMDKREREAFEQDLNLLAAAARAVGIHLVIATQHPSAEIVTPKLKANLDARIAFRVASNVNSRVVLDTNGAENLLGRGDMLFRKQSGEIVRLQAPFMDEEQMQAYLTALLTSGSA